MTNTTTSSGLWLAITVLTAVIIATAGGVLAWLGGSNPPRAILAAGGTFAGALLLGITVLQFATAT